LVQDVHAALLESVKAYMQCDDSKAAALLQELVKEKRYVRDVWS